jgi:mRNA interferase MazF
MSKGHKRGDIFLVRLDPVIGSEQGGTRPCIVVQNDKGNALAPTTLVVPLSANIPEIAYPFHVLLQPSETGLPKPCIAKCEQIKVVAVEGRFVRRLGAVSKKALRRLEKAILYELGIDADDHAGFGDLEQM